MAAYYQRTEERWVAAYYDGRRRWQYTMRGLKRDGWQSTMMGDLGGSLL